MIKSKIILFSIVLSCLFLFALVLSVSAATVTFELDAIFSDKPSSYGDAPWLTAVFKDGDTKGSVELNLSANLKDSDFVSEWYFNFDPSLHLTKLKITPIAEIYTCSNAYKADGAGNFDISFKFPPKNSPSSDRFDNSETITYLITSTEAISAASFGFFNEARGGSEGRYLSAAHLQGIDSMGRGKHSTWIGAVSSVSLSRSILFFGSGLIGAVGLARRKF